MSTTYPVEDNTAVILVPGPALEDGPAHGQGCQVVKVVRSRIITLFIVEMDRNRPIAMVIQPESRPSLLMLLEEK